MSRRALLLINRQSRNGARSFEMAIAALGRHDIEIVYPDPSLTLSEAIYACADRIDLVIVGGGDGSLNTAAAALMATGLPLGILPLGTANDLARTLAIPKDLNRAVAIIAVGNLRQLDVGMVNERPFFNVASIGFSASLAKNLTAASKKRWGVLGYAFAALKLFRQSRPFTVQIDHHGQQETVKTMQISVGNGRFYGGGMTVEQSATPDDGQLDVYSLELDHWWEMLALAPYLRRGTHGKWRKVRAFPATALTITTRRPHAINADGEIVGTTPAQFSIRPQAIKVFAPPAK